MEMIGDGDLIHNGPSSGGGEMQTHSGCHCERGEAMVALKLGNVEYNEESGNVGCGRGIMTM